MTDARVDTYIKVGDFNLDLHYVVAEAQCSFKQPIFYPNELIIKQFCEKVGRSSFTLFYEFFVKNDLENICAEGRLIMVCFRSKIKTSDSFARSTI